MAGRDVECGITRQQESQDLTVPINVGDLETGFTLLRPFTARHENGDDKEDDQVFHGIVQRVCLS
jgi:hypothetical protein